MKLNFRYIPAHPIKLPNGAKRPFVFYHIPRCGGTTLCMVLQIAARTANRNMTMLHGTVYGQFLGPKKTESADSINDHDYSEGPIVAGHIPWGSIGSRAPTPIAVTALRDPGDRMVSHYKLGVLRGGWDIDTPVKELRAKGLIIENVATRMLSGVTSIDGDIDEKTLRVAKTNLSKAFLVADLHRLDDLCSSVLGVFGCPDVLLVRGNEASTDLAPERYELVRAASEELDHLDRQLFEQVRGKLLSMDTEIIVQDGGDPRPYFILTIPFASTVSGVQAIKVEKSRLPDIESFLRSKLADHDVSVTLPQGHIP